MHAHANPANQTKRVLLVDDNEDYAELLGLALTMRGNIVRIEHDGPSGLKLAERFQPDVLVLDIGLPGMNGYEVAAKLRQSARATRIIALSGYPDREERAAANLFDGYLLKPAGLDELLRLIAG